MEISMMGNGRTERDRGLEFKPGLMACSARVTGRMI